MNNDSLTILILAAGKGTRMKSDRAKVLHEICFTPMIHHVIRATLPLMPRRTVLIVGHQRTEVQSAVKAFEVDFAVQHDQLGTGHAVLSAEKTIAGDGGTVMILCGDTPLIQPETLLRMYDQHRHHGAPLTLMTTVLDDPTNYGRILSDASGSVRGIVEQKDASEEQREIQEINAGIYCVEKDHLFSSLKKVDTDNAQGEIYLTDIVGLTVAAGLKVEKFTTQRPGDVLGVNSRIELAAAGKELQRRRNNSLMLEGISLVDPDTVRIAPDCIIGTDTVIEPGACLKGGTSIGRGCTIGQGSILTHCHLGDHVTVGPYSCLDNCSITAGTAIAPMTTSMRDINQ